MRTLARPLILTAILSAACGGPRVDLTKGLEVAEFSSGWVSAGRVDGQNKIVPSITFKLKNISDQPLPSLQANVMFRQINSPEEWGSGFVSVTRSESLAPGATSQAVTINSQRGYTGTEAAPDMLNNSLFVDAKVDLFAKYGPVQWVRVGERPIERRLIAQ
jgi:hypothetical protein